MSDDSGPRVNFSEVRSEDTSNPKPLETWSEFGDASCGEPQFAQHVVLDFTPTDEDNDIVQQKVCSFWQFINNRQEIQNLKVQAKKEVYTEDSDTGIASESAKSSAKDKNLKKVPDKDTIETMELAVEKKIVDTALKTKTKSIYSLGLSKFSDTLPKKQEKIKHVCKSIPCRNPNCRNKKAFSRDETSSMSELNKMMSNWDAKHPKSMDPPGHSPPLQHCLIQRQMFSDL